jgi:two-component system sensor histidine kinase KdpD
MLMTVSHDLKTPLATIVGSLEICHRMEKSLSGEKKNILVNLALTEAHRLNNFITHLLDIVRLETGITTTHPEHCNLTQLIQDCISSISASRFYSIRMDRIGDDYAVVDPMLFGRAIYLVLETAMTQTPSKPEITLQYGHGVDGMMVCVHYNGIGLPYGENQIAFNKYTRFSRSDMQNAGSGLSLTVCSMLVNLLGGSLQMENEADGRVMITLRVPHKED